MTEEKLLSQFKLTHEIVCSNENKSGRFDEIICVKIEHNKECFYIFCGKYCGDFSCVHKDFSNDCHYYFNHDLHYYVKEVCDKKNINLNEFEKKLIKLINDFATKQSGKYSLSYSFKMFVLNNEEDEEKFISIAKDLLYKVLSYRYENKYKKIFLLEQQFGNKQDYILAFGKFIKLNEYLKIANWDHPFFNADDYEDE